MAKITSRHKGDQLFETELGNHVVSTDPRGAQGPAPLQVLVASLGACVGVLVADYCERSGISTDELSVDVEYDKASNPYRLADFKVHINLPDGGVDGRAAAIRRVAEHCPVHQTMCSLEGAEITVNGKAA
ncbi:MAG: OsmC family protein [Anaerolineae bacterium]